MQKLFIVALVGAELFMLAGKAPHIPGPTLMAPKPVDGKFARETARRVAAEAQAAAEKTSHRQAVAACLGPNAEAMSPSRHEARVKLCEARLAGQPIEDPEAPVYYAPASPPQQTAAEAPAAPADAG